MEILPYAAAKDTLSTEIASGSAPDIIGPVGWAGSNAFYGQYLDIAPYIKSSGFDTSVFNPALVKMYETSQGTVGLPFAVYPSALFVQHDAVRRGRPELPARQVRRSVQGSRWHDGRLVLDRASESCPGTDPRRDGK